jgi:hypothetical protein
MDNPEKLATMDTQDTGQRQRKQINVWENRRGSQVRTIQRNWQHCGCQFLWIVHSWLPLRFSLTFICFVCLRPVSCVPNVTSVSGLSILDCHFGVRENRSGNQEWTIQRHWQNWVHKTGAFIFFVLCLVYPMLPVSLDCPFLIVTSVFFLTVIY